MPLLLRILLAVTLIELIVGGGGRVFEIGGLTLRMCLFFSNLVVVSLLYLQKGKIDFYVIGILLSVTAVLLFYAVLGFSYGAEGRLIYEDVKPLSYFFSILFFSLFINNVKSVHRVVVIIKKTSLIMAVVYIAIQLLFYFNLIDFRTFYVYINSNVSASDFFFRGTQGLFFYKGFMYMVVGLIFWIHSSPSSKRNVIILTIMIAMVLTGTRGFVLMFILLYAIFYGIPLLLRLNLKVLVLSIALLVGSLFFFFNTDLGNKVAGDSIRWIQLQQVFERINPLSAIIGHGFGNGVPIRPVHMEIGYLEVFHKQGVLGLFLWALLFLIIYNEYVKSKTPLKRPFFLSCFFVLLLSLTNPFFNNPLGISVFIISLVAFKVLNRSATVSTAQETAQTIP